MRRTSQSSLDAVTTAFQPVLAAAGAQAATLGTQLFLVVDTLDSTSALRRALSDPAREGEAKVRLAAEVFGKKVDPRVIEVLSGLVRSRWSAELDLTEAVEQLAADAILAAAQNDGSLEMLEEELFRVLRMLAHEREVRRSLTEVAATADARAALAQSLFADKVGEYLLQLISRAVRTPRGRGLVASLTQIEQLVSRRRDKLVASVASATELTQEQELRLTALLENAYARSVQLNITVDPGVVGGMRIQIGPDVVNATVLSRLQDVRRRLAG